MTDLLTPENSQFRSWFRNCLGSLSGNTIEWPFLKRQILAEELRRLSGSDQYYKGSVFRNRDDRVETHRTRDSEDEEILVYRLYGARTRIYGDSSSRVSNLTCMIFMGVRQEDCVRRRTVDEQAGDSGKDSGT